MNAPCSEYSIAFGYPFDLAKDRDMLRGGHIHIVFGINRSTKAYFLKENNISVL